MKILICTALIAIASATGFAEPLRSGMPLQAGGPRGLGILSFPKAYNNSPVGYAFLSNPHRPDLFVATPSGIEKAFYRLRPAADAPDGSRVYSPPEKINVPWEDQKELLVARIITFNNKLYAFRIDRDKVLEVAIFDPNSNSFTPQFSIDIDSLPKNISSMDIISINGGTIDFALSAHSGGYVAGAHRKEGDTSSMYDGSGIYRWKLPYARLYRMTVDINGRRVTAPVKPLSADSKFMIGSGGSVIRVCTQPGNLNGLIVSNQLGALVYLPMTSANDSKLNASNRLMDPDRNMLLNPSFGTKLLAVPQDDSPDSPCDFIAGGESALYYYSYSGKSDEDGNPIYLKPRKLLQEKAALYGGSLAVPTVVDWDGDGVADLIAGNSEGRLLFFKNCGSNAVPNFNGVPEELQANGNPIVIRPGYYVVQGPLEAAWGYLCPNVIDWNKDGRPDVLYSGSIAKHQLMLNSEKGLSAPRSLAVDGLELYGTWRVRPAVAAINGRMVYVMMDDENALHLYNRLDNYNLSDGGKLRMADGNFITGHLPIETVAPGQKGRSVINLVDWDRDGRLDLIIGCGKRASFPTPENGLPMSRCKKKQYGLQVLFFKNVGSNTDMKFANPKQFQLKGKDFYLGAHNNAPTPCQLGDTSKGQNLLVGAEDGRFYFFNHADLTVIE